MEAWVLIKIKTHPQIDGPGAQMGDIIDIYPVTSNWRNMGIQTLNHFFPIRIAMSIPCGDGIGDAAGTFTIGPRGLNYKCSSCKYNDPDLCERIKYLKALWGVGDIENPPVLIKKRIHWIDRNEDLSLTGAIRNLITNSNKTESQMQQIVTFMSTRPILKTLIRSKL